MAPHLMKSAADELLIKLFKTFYFQQAENFFDVVSSSKDLFKFI